MARTKSTTFVSSKNTLINDTTIKSWSKHSEIRTERITKDRFDQATVGNVGLATLGRLGAIGITIMAISIGSSYVNFGVSELVQNTPNYNVTNTYIPIDDPLNDIDYNVYGQPIIENIRSYLRNLEWFGGVANAMWRGIVIFFGGEFDPPSYGETTTSFITEFGQTRFNELLAFWDNGFTTPYHNWDVFQDLTEDEIEYLATTNPIYFGGYGEVSTGFTSNPYQYFTHRPLKIFGTLPWNDEFVWWYNVPSIAMFARGDY
jgi:hypothetical protein